MSSNTFEITISDALLDNLAKRIAIQLEKSVTHDKTLTQKETAAILRVSNVTVCRWIKAGKILPVPGCNDRIPRAEIRRLLRESES